MPEETIIFLSSKSPFTAKSWSGIPYFMYQALIQHYKIKYVEIPSFKLLRLLGYYLNRFFQAVTGKKYLFDYGIFISLLSGLAGSIRLKKIGKAKFIFSPSGFVEIAFLRTSIPIINCSDCSMLQLIDYYPALNNVLAISKWEIKFLESRAFCKGTLNFFSSDWATHFVATKFSLKNGLTIPFGANLFESPTALQPKKVSSDRCTLIFVGVDWVRKGGDSALKIVEEIRHLGVDCKITIIGSSGETVLNDSNIEVLKSIDKITEAKVYEEKFRNSDFMILPTFADCTPIVIAEAFAFGVPVVTYDTGGISSMVKNGINGFLIEAGEEPLEFAKIIIRSIADTEVYNMLSAGCYESFKSKFNWNQWVLDLMQHIENKKLNIHEHV